MTTEKNKIDYVLWCPICDKKALAPFPPIAVGVTLDELKEVQLDELEKAKTLIYEQICSECFHNQDA